MPDITLPIPGVTPGPQYAQMIVDALTTLNVAIETGTGGESSGYEFVQSTPLASWSIAHAFGRKPNVSVFIGGEEVIADVTASSTNVTVSFAAPQTGTATLT